MTIKLGEPQWNVQFGCEQLLTGSDWIKPADYVEINYQQMPPRRIKDKTFSFDKAYSRQLNLTLCYRVCMVFASLTILPLISSQFRYALNEAWYNKRTVIVFKEEAPKYVKTISEIQKKSLPIDDVPPQDPTPLEESNQPWKIVFDDGDTLTVDAPEIEVLCKKSTFFKEAKEQTASMPKGFTKQHWQELFILLFDKPGTNELQTEEWLLRARHFGITSIEESIQKKLCNDADGPDDFIKLFVLANDHDFEYIEAKTLNHFNTCIQGYTDENRKTIFGYLKENYAKLTAEPTNEKLSTSFFVSFSIFKLMIENNKEKNPDQLVSFFKDLSPQDFKEMITIFFKRARNPIEKLNKFINSLHELDIKLPLPKETIPAIFDAVVPLIGDDLTALQKLTYKKDSLEGFYRYFSVEQLSKLIKQFKVVEDEYFKAFQNGETNLRWIDSKVMVKLGIKETEEFWPENGREPRYYFVFKALATDYEGISQLNKINSLLNQNPDIQIDDLIKIAIGKYYPRGYFTALTKDPETFRYWKPVRTEFDPKSERILLDYLAALKFIQILSSTSTQEEKKKNLKETFGLLDSTDNTAFGTDDLTLFGWALAKLCPPEHIPLILECCLQSSTAVSRCKKAFLETLRSDGNLQESHK